MPVSTVAAPPPSISTEISIEVSLVSRARVACLMVRSLPSMARRSLAFGLSSEDLRKCAEEAVALFGRPDRHPQASLQPGPAVAVADEHGSLDQLVPHPAAGLGQGPEQDEVRLRWPGLDRKLGQCGGQP